MAFANAQKVEGKTDLAEYIMNRGTKAINEIITNAWNMYNAETAMRWRAKSRLDILNDSFESEPPAKHVDSGKRLPWRLCTTMKSHQFNLAHVLGTYSWTEGGKFRNLMLTGAANCGKTFLLDPLNKIYKTFTNPASTSFAWVGAKNAEIIFLNDFRWSPQVIAWHDLLLLLEGQQVNLPAPKSHFAKDVTLTGGTPIFCTNKRPLVYIKNRCIDDWETELIKVRGKVINLTYQIPENEIKEQACSSCFLRFILQTHED